MLKRTQNKRVLKFLNYLKKLQTIEAMGVAGLLQVPLVYFDEESEESQESGPAKSSNVVERDQDSILADMIDAFVNESSSKQKFILDIMKAATMED